MFLKKLKNISLIILILIAMSCKEDKTQTVSELIEMDKEFCKYSLNNGHQKAFLKFCSKDVVILKNNHYPIKGITELKLNYKENPDSNQLTWEPLHATMAESNDLGYTYGTWEYTVLHGENKGKKNAGCYVTIWKKQQDGSWKFCFDSGTSGLSK